MGNNRQTPIAIPFAQIYGNNDCNLHEKLLEILSYFDNDRSQLKIVPPQVMVSIAMR